MKTVSVADPSIGAPEDALQPILPKSTALDDTPRFGDVVSRDLLEFISKDPQLSKAKLAIDSRMKDRGIERGAAVKAYLPIVDVACKKFYAIVGSDQREYKDVFDSFMQARIASKFVEDVFGGIART